MCASLCNTVQNLDVYIQAEDRKWVWSSELDSMTL